MKEHDFELIEEEMRKGKERFFSWISSLGYINACSGGPHVTRDLYYKEYASHKEMAEDFDCMLSILGNVPYVAFMVDRTDKKVLRKIDHRMEQGKFYEATRNVYPAIADWMLRYGGRADIYEPYLPGYINCNVKEERYSLVVKSRETLLTDKLFLNDYFFRTEGEVPDGYEWDEGEYEGWLQYRWGDGKNAVERKKENKPSGTPSPKGGDFYAEHMKSLSDAVKIADTGIFKGFTD